MRRLMLAYVLLLGFGGSASAQSTSPTSILTRPNNTIAYALNNLIASSVTAGSVAVPSFATPGGGAIITRLRLVTNKAAGWDTVPLRVRLWSAAPTYTGGDGAAYTIATGAAGLLGQFDISLVQYGDGAAGIGVAAVGSAIWLRLASAMSVYWDIQYTGSAALTPAANQTFTLTAELAN